MEQHLLESPTDVEERCLELGFLPFFRCGIPGFSIEEMVAREYWFTDEEWAWEWKGPIIRDGQCAYGKFFNRKAGFVSRAWLPDWANYRRSLHLAPNDDAAALDDVVLQTILAEGSATIKELRRMLGFARGADGGRRRTSNRRWPRMRKYRSTQFSRGCRWRHGWSSPTSNTTSTATATPTAGAWRATWHPNRSTARFGPSVRPRSRLSASATTSGSSFPPFPRAASGG